MKAQSAYQFAGDLVNAERVDTLLDALFDIEKQSRSGGGLLGDIRDTARSAIVSHFAASRGTTTASPVHDSSHTAGCPRRDWPHADCTCRLIR